MQVKILCTNPACGISFGMPERELSRLGSCPACGWKLSQGGSEGEEFDAKSDANSDDVPPTIDPSSEVLSKPASMPSFPETREAADEFAPGSIFAGRFRIVKVLGVGGMGKVFQAFDQTLGRDVAIKVPLFLHDANFLERFQREARTAAKLKHPNICPIYDVSEYGGRPFIVMDFIDGVALGDYLKQRKEPFHLVKAAKLIRALALSLHDLSPRLEAGERRDQPRGPADGDGLRPSQSRGF